MDKIVNMSKSDDLCRFLGEEKYVNFIRQHFTPEDFIKTVPSRWILNDEEKLNILLNSSKHPDTISYAEQKILKSYVYEQITENEREINDITLKELEKTANPDGSKDFYKSKGRDIKRKLSEGKNYLLTSSFRRVSVPTKDSDVFIGTTNIDPLSEWDRNFKLTYIIKIWDKDNHNKEQAQAIDKKFYDELKNNNYYRRIGLNHTERQMTGHEKDFNFLIMTYLNGSDALEIGERLEENVSSTINPTQKLKAIKEKDMFREKLCKEIARIHAYSSKEHVVQEGEDFKERVQENVINTYRNFFLKNQHLLDSELQSGLEERLSVISNNMKAGFEHMIAGLNVLVNSYYTDRFQSNMIVDDKGNISHIDYGSNKLLPAQFDLAFPFIQGNDTPKDVKINNLRTYFETFTRYAIEFNSFVDEKLNNLEDTMLDEIRRFGICSHDKANVLHAVSGYLEIDETLKDLKIEDIDVKKDQVYRTIDSVVEKSKIHNGNKDKIKTDLKGHIEEIIDYMKNLKKKDSFLPAYDANKEVVPATFDEFCEGMAVSEAYRALIIGSAYTHYMKESIDEVNLDYFINMIGSSLKAWNWYSSDYLEHVDQDKITAFKDSLIEWKGLALKLKKGYIEQYGTKKNNHFVDFHIHTGATEDARRKDSIIENNLINVVHAAQRNGLKHIALTNHLYLFGESGNDTSDIEYLSRECELIDRLKDKTGVTIHKGLEVDYLGKENEEAVRKQVQDIIKVCNGLDYILGSVHRIEGEWFLPSKDFKKVWSGKDPVEHHRKYFNLMLDSVKSGIFNYVAHPGVISKFIQVPFDEYKDIVDKICKVTVAGDVGLEVNVMGLKHPYGGIYPNKDILTRYIDECIVQDKRPNLIIGSDSHSPLHMNRAIDEKLLLKGYMHSLDCGYDGNFIPYNKRNNPLKK